MADNFAFAVGLKSKLVLEPEARVKSTTVIVPMEFLGAKLPPFPTVTQFATFPDPLSVAPLCMAMGEGVDPLIDKMPADIVVGPVNVFTPVKLSAPFSVLVKAPEPPIALEKVFVIPIAIFMTAVELLISPLPDRASTPLLVQYLNCPVPLMVENPETPHSTYFSVSCMYI